jgi:hypothetical protein
MREITERKQKAAVAGAMGVIMRERMNRYEKVAALAGYQFGENESEDETCIAWPGAGIFVNSLRNPTDAPSGKGVVR